MADPLSLAGLVTGLVSIGLQVACSVTSYLDTINTRAPNLTFIRRQVEAVEENLRLIDSLRARVQVTQNASDNLKRSVRMCEDELKNLECILQNEGANTSTTALQPQGKWARRRQILTYPLREPLIRRLQDRFETVNGLLQTALQAMELDLHLATLEIMGSTHAEAVAANARVSSLMRPVQEIHNALPGLHGALARLGPACQHHTDMQTQRLQGSLIEIRDAQHIISEKKCLHNELVGDHCNQYLSRIEKVLQEHQVLSSSQGSQNSQMGPRDVLLSRLVAKPGSLRELSDIMNISMSQAPKDNDQTHQYSPPKVKLSDKEAVFCGLFCKRHKRERHHQRLLGIATMFYENKDPDYHSPGCPLAGRHPRGYTYAWGVIVTGLNRLVARSIEISFSITVGAGGYSVAHEIRYHATVDPKRAPAFRLINLALDCVGSSRHEQVKLPLTHQDHIVKLCISTIAELFRGRRAGPTDLLPAGDSLITRIPFLILCQPGEGSSLLLTLFRKMVNYGVPIRVRERPLYHLETSYFKTPLTTVKLVLETMATNDTVILPPEILNCTIPNTLLHAHLFWILSESIELSELSGLNVPLCRAVLAGDENRVADILNRFPDCLEESTITGRSAIDLAVREPACLRLILRHAKPHQLRHRRAGISTLAVIVLILSSLRPCPVAWGDDGPARESECYRPECVSLDLSLEAGCEQRLDDLTSVPWNRASPHAKRIYLLHMRKRRQELRDLALRYLSNSQIASMGLSSTAVLDVSVVAVIERLQAMKVQLPPVIDGLLSDCASVTSGGSIYHYIENTEDAELVWDLGFRDVSTLDNHGRTPMSKTRSLPYINWLVSHGVTILSSWLGISKQAATGTTNAHFVASLFFSEDHAGHDRQASEGLAPALFADVFDCCECRCSQQGGCTPLLSGLKAAVKSASNLQDACDSLIDMFPDRIDLEAAKTVTRLLTFEALSLPHTCCMFVADDFKKQYTTSDMVELDQVYSEEIEQFNLCVDALIQELQTQQDTSPISAEILRVFIHTTWTNTVQREKYTNLNVGKEQQAFKEAEKLGVVWQPTMPDEAPDFTSLEYWVGEIDKIVEGKATTYQEYRTV